MKYYKPLDSLRALAAAMVVAYHWTGEQGFASRIMLGAIGVNTFFILSGFLISSILFRQRTEETLNPGKALGSFYARRALRIFPPYYALVLLVIFFRPQDFEIPGDKAYFLTYTSNFLFYLNRSWDGPLSLSWSLSVEEQFYLLWPLAVLFLPRRALKGAVFALIVLGLGSQFAMRGDGNIFRSILPSNCLHLFGFGAWLAWERVFAAPRFGTFVKTLRIASGVAALAFIAWLASGQRFYLPMRLTNAVAGAWLIGEIVRRDDRGSRRGAWLLENPVLLYLGRISYGLYLYHIHSRLLAAWLLHTDPNAPRAGFARIGWLGLNAALLLAIASLSYFTLEKFFRDLKRKVPYARD